MDILEPSDKRVLLIVTGYKGLCGTDGRYVQDSNGITWLADASAEQIQCVVWETTDYKNEQPNCRLNFRERADSVALAYAASSHIPYIRVLLQLETDAAVPLARLGPHYETMHILAKLRWLVHRAKGNLRRTVFLQFIAQVVSNSRMNP